MVQTHDRIGHITRTRYAAAVAVTLAILVLTINEVGYYDLSQHTGRRDDAQEAAATVQRLRLVLVDAESAQRGYLLTQRDPYKAHFTKQLGDLRVAIDRVSALAATTESQRGPLRQLADLAARKVAELQRTIHLSDAGNREAALALVRTDIGREQMAAISHLVDQIAAAENRVFAAAGEQRDRSLLWSRAGIACLVALCLAAVFAALRLARARERERIEQRNALQAERDNLETEVEHRTRELTLLATHLQTVREDERSRLARELHDELGGLLTAAKLEVARLKNRLASAGPDVGERIGQLARALDAGIALKRRIIEDLCPSSLSNLGLTPALRILCAEFAKRSEIAVEARLDEVPLGAAAALSVYRLVQEALTNVAKYASARNVEVALARDGRHALVTVTDDGRGFVVADTTVGHGLAGMQFRMRSGGGAMTLHSAPGRGTRIEARLPLS